MHIWVKELQDHVTQNVYKLYIYSKIKMKMVER